MIRPLPSPGHQAKRLAPDQEGAAQVDPDQPVEVFSGRLEQRFFDQDAGIVDQDVEPAEALLDGLEQSQHLRLVGDVRLHREDAALGGREVGDRDRGALRRERQRDRAADPGGAARDQGAPAVEGAGHAITSPRSTL